MYGNAPSREEEPGGQLTAKERKVLRKELSSVAARTRELLPGEFAVGSELSSGHDGPRATVAVQPPVGAIVSADYTPEDEIDIADAEREDIATGLAASAALQVKEAMSSNDSPSAK
jgi:hypothetical protein